MIDNDENGGRYVSGANAKRYLRAVIHTLVGESLEPWSALLPESKVDVSSHSMSDDESATPSIGPTALGFLRLMAAEGFNHDDGG